MRDIRVAHRLAPHLALHLAYDVPLASSSVHGTFVLQSSDHDIGNLNQKLLLDRAIRIRMISRQRPAGNSDDMSRRQEQGNF
jgi:hypothetical protein